MKRISAITYQSPCGELLLAETEGCLCMCDWIDATHHSRLKRRLSEHLKGAFLEEKTETLSNAARQLDEYFGGERCSFDIPLLLPGTDFQTAIWNELMTIPYGHTESYANLSRCIGRPDAVRAVANAVGANPVSIIVPCHRIVGSNGSLTGYAGGIPAKAFLLSLESRSL